MKTSTALFIALAFCAPSSSFACEETSAQLEDYYIRARQLEERYLVELAKEVDQVFTGVVTEVDLLESGPYAQRAHIRIDELVKGKPTAFATALMHLRRNPERDLPLDRIAGCFTPPDPAQKDPYVLKTYRYLFYVKDGILMRANGFPLGPPLLEPPEEIEILKRRAPAIGFGE